MVDRVDSKSTGIYRVGSSPTTCTTFIINGCDYMKKTTITFLICAFIFCSCGSISFVEDTAAIETACLPTVESTLEPWTTEHAQDPTIYLNTSDYPKEYRSESCTITITKEWFEDAYCYIAHLQFTDYIKFGTACANGKYNNGYETTSSAAKRLGAIFAVNGDYSSPSMGNGVVRSGVVCVDKACNMPAVYSSVTGIFCAPENLNIVGQKFSDLVADKTVTDTFGFFNNVLIKDGKVVNFSNDSRAQRTFIGTTGAPGDIWIVVSEGRYVDGKSAGLTFNQCASLLINKGCVFAISLDGGGSSTMVFNGEVLNHLQGGRERPVVDFVYYIG